jgi:hypothetical protein
MVKMPLYKYKDVSTLSGMEHLEDIIQNDRLYCSCYSKLNDAFEGAYEYYPISETGFHTLDDDHVERLKIDKKDIRVCCLTKQNNNRLMWGYYGSFKGVVIEVEFDMHSNSIIKAQDVKYSEQPPTLSTKNLLSAEKLLLIKLKDWEHEEEVRVLSKEEHIDVRVRGIILGQRISFENEDRIKELVQKKNELCPNNKIMIYKQKELALDVERI